MGYSSARLLLIVLTFQDTFAEEFDYCSISNYHTMCMYKTISRNCVQYKMQSEKTSLKILNDHNAARSKFAGGSLGYFVPNMMKLYWDQELADLSSRWACQCKGGVDLDRAVSRFEVGQVVYTLMKPWDFVKWDEIWRSITNGKLGFFQRDYWNRMITNHDPSVPLSFVYNPYVRYLGCTLAKYLVWSVKASKFAYTTSLICNYGPIAMTYPKKIKEDWPCRYLKYEYTCPDGYLCFPEYHLKGEFLPKYLPNQRNLCMDPQMEYDVPLPGKTCRSPKNELASRMIGGIIDMAHFDDLSESNYTYGEGIDTDVPEWFKEEQNETTVNLKEVTNDGDNSEDDERMTELRDDADYFQKEGRNFFDFCDVICANGQNHTLCKYRTTSTKCKNFLVISNSMVEEDLLHLHNEFRDKYTEGLTNPPHPLASNLVVMKWSNLLRDIAFRWIEQCTIGHDDCRDTLLPDVSNPTVDKIYTVSQNIAWRYFKNNESIPSHRELFHDWVGQSELFKFRSLTDYLQYKDDNEDTINAKDFIQLIWAKTRYLGCAYGSWRKKTDLNVAFLVCNYAPQGRESGKAIYVPGGPCSNCLTETEFQWGRCQETYPNLCNGFVRSPKIIFMTAPSILVAYLLTFRMRTIPLFMSIQPT